MSQVCCSRLPFAQVINPQLSAQHRGNATQSIDLPLSFNDHAGDVQLPMGSEVTKDIAVPFASQFSSSFQLAASASTSSFDSNPSGIFLSFIPLIHSMASFVGLTVDAPGSGHSHQPSTPSMSRASCFKLLYLSWHKDRRRKHPMFLSPGAYPILISFATWFFDLTLTLFLVSSTTEAAPPKKRQALARPEEHLSQGEGSSPRPAQSKKRITHNRVPDSESEKDDGSEKGDGSETDNISEKGHNSDSEEYDDSVM